ncbi:hypothetical protein [Bacillus anthracis]
MDEKLEGFDKKVDTEVEKLISCLGFEIHENMTPDEYCQLSRDMGAQGISIKQSGDIEGDTYRVTIQVEKVLEIKL